MLAALLLLAAVSPVATEAGCASCNLVPCGYCQQGCRASTCTFEFEGDKASVTSRNGCATKNGVLNAGQYPPTCRPATAADTTPTGGNTDRPVSFEETFTSGKDGLDAGKWLVAKKQWGGAGNNGGVVPENVYLPGDGTVVLKAHGDLYTGPVRGVEKKDNTWVDLQHGRRTGAAIATKEYFASGVYEVRMKVAPVKGVCSSVWTFHYEEVYPPGAPMKVINHEIDVELPGRPGQVFTDISHKALLANTWVGEKETEYKVGYTKDLPAQDDGEYHVYKFIWHTGDAATQQEKRVDFYVDGTKVSTSTEHIPTRAGRFWIGAWFPNNWAGDPNFAAADMVIDYVKITPLHEAGDEYVPESYPNFGWGSLEDIMTTPATVAPTAAPTDAPTYATSTAASQCAKAASTIAELTKQVQELTAKLEKAEACTAGRGRRPF